MASVSSKCPEGNVSRMENKKAYRDGKVEEEEGGGVEEGLPLFSKLTQFSDQREFPSGGGGGVKKHKVKIQE